MHSLVLTVSGFNQFQVKAILCLTIQELGDCLTTLFSNLRSNYTGTWRLFNYFACLVTYLVTIQELGDCLTTLFNYTGTWRLFNYFV